VSYRIYLYPGDRWGCGSYRMIWPAAAVAALRPDWHVEVVAPEARAVHVGFNFKGQVCEEKFPADADAIVLQRPTVKFLADMIPLARARGCAVIVDMDDDLGHIHPANPAFATLAKRIRHPESGVWLDNPHSAPNAARACALATLVTVTTPLLAKVYANPGGAGTVVVPNYIPGRYLDVEHVDSDLVGWGGSVHSHPDDLQQVGPAVGRLLADGGRFETVGRRDEVGRVLGLAEDPPGPGPVGLDDWPMALSQFGVGIAPLADTRFNTAKSRLKPLELNAVGVPCVASPTDDYSGWAAESAGTVLARRPREWGGLLRALANDPERRQEMSEAGREAARVNTIEGNAWRWAEAWQAAVDHQRGLSTAGALKVTAGAQ